MRISRRALGVTVAAALARPRSASAQATPTPQQHLEQLRKEEQEAFQEMAKIKLPRATEPAFKFLA